MEDGDLDLENLKLLRESFHSEAMETLASMEETLLALEGNHDSPDLVATLFRGAHTIKGNARLVGLDHIGEFTHIFEDLLDGMRSGSIPVTSDLISAALLTVDSMREMIEAAVGGEDRLREEHRDLMANLAELAKAKGSDTQTRENGAAASDGSVHAGGVGARARTRTLRVGINKLDRMMDLVGEISIARGRVTEMLQNGDHLSGREALEVHREADLLYMELQELVMQMRMVPLGPLFREYLRLVRDMSMESGKGARLVIEGEDVEVDTTVVENLRDPLMHLVRNAVNHGIESTEQRLESGKNPVGTVLIRASHKAGTIVIEVSDDGAGLDEKSLLKTARAKGFVGEDETPPAHDLYNLIFEPGFSTADEITEDSGRGVGMDVVRKNVDLLRGTVTVNSRQGKGATITMRLPLTLAIIDGFRVGVEHETYVVPMDHVVECMELPEESKNGYRGKGVINLRDKPVPYLGLRSFFKLGGAPPLRENVLIVKHEGEEVGFAVDALLGEGQTVIKPLNKMFKEVPGLAGSSIMGNGQVAFILDVPGLMKEVLRGASELGAAL